MRTRPGDSVMALPLIEHLHAPCRGTYACFDGITTDEVFGHVERALARADGRAAST